MDFLFDPSLGVGGTVLLLVCLLTAFGFEFVNGFHDTANAVATVIYTNALKPTVAVVLSGACNFFGVFFGGIAVAVGIIKLLPVDLLVDAGRGAAMAMVLSLLLAAILWNLGTWYLGLPASSSHTMIGAILGVGLAHSGLAGVNLHKAEEIGRSLLVSPLLGFCLAGGLLWLLKTFVKVESLFKEPPKNTPPPMGIRALLVATCAGVSFSHGSNDGQKGVGLVMLILMAVVPGQFALDRAATEAELGATMSAVVRMEQSLAKPPAGLEKPAAEAQKYLASVKADVGEAKSVAQVAPEKRANVRRALVHADKAVAAIVETGKLSADVSKQLDTDRKAMMRMTNYAPIWVLVGIALALGVGTTVGWKRIVVTVGEKIGKAHLTYAQGACAEAVAAGTIGLSSLYGLPVSTTHVLSSGVAGTMVAQGSGVQRSTLVSIGLAWVLTLPVSMALSAALFYVFRALLG